MIRGGAAGAAGAIIFGLAATGVAAPAPSEPPPPAYYECPQLCSLVLGGAVAAMHGLERGGWRRARWPAAVPGQVRAGMRAAIRRRMAACHDVDVLELLAVAEPLRAVMTMHRRDIIVIGCSAGGVEALPRVLQQLPPNLGAAILIVQHMAPTNTPYLVSILRRSSQLPVEWAEQGAEIARQRIVVGPPDVHLVVSEQHILLTKGARENHARPSINKLFRSAAAAYGSRVIGVLLTGMLEDGVTGLQAIRDAGGTVIVQDPRDAAFPELPSRALRALDPDRVLPIDAIGAALVGLVGDDVTVVTPPRHVAIEAELDRQPQAAPADMSSLGPQTVLTCPECHGPMWQLGDEKLRRFRCYLGHVVTAGEMLTTSTVEIEAALWSAVRALNDRAITLETLATDAARIGSHQTSESYTSRAREARQQVEIARKFMLDLAAQR